MGAVKNFMEIGKDLEMVIKTIIQGIKNINNLDRNINKVREIMIRVSKGLHTVGKLVEDPNRSMDKVGVSGLHPDRKVCLSSAKNKQEVEDSHETTSLL